MMANATRLTVYQRCPQNVKSQDRDETETVNLQDQDETETFHFFKLSRPRRDRDVQPSRPRGEEMFKKTSRDCLKTETTSLEMPMCKMRENVWGVTPQFTDANTPPVSAAVTIKGNDGEHRCGKRFSGVYCCSMHTATYKCMLILKVFYSVQCSV